MNILITSPRAPVALEWAKIAHAGGHRVIFADTLRFPVGRFARGLDAQYCRIPAPRLDFAAYAEAMRHLLAQADWVIPTCEDIFYLAQIGLPPEQRAKCFMPEGGLLFGLHDKYRFFEHMPPDAGIRFPATRLVRSPQEAVPDGAGKTVLKPVYSRFGRQVIRGVGLHGIQAAGISPQRPWVQQQFVEGEGVCNYAVCEHGRVIAHAAYRPRYLLNQAAATYFEPLDDPRLSAFTAAFAAQNRYHGQAAFDFIDDGRDLWLLECNPRATSGLHLLRHTLAFDADGRLQNLKQRLPETPLRVGASLPLLFGAQALRHGTWRSLWRDYRRAGDVLDGLPPYAPWLAFGEMLYRSVRYRRPLTDASTFDIEFDGDG